MVRDEIKMACRGIILNRRGTYNYVPKRKQVKMEADGGSKIYRESFRLRNLLFLLNKSLGRGSVQPKFCKNGGSEETQNIFAQKVNAHLKCKDSRSILFWNVPFLKDLFIYLKIFFEARF